MVALLQGISKWSMLSWWDELWEGILNNLVNETIGPLLWGLCDIFFIILDLFEWLFKAFAGTSEGGVTVQGQKVEGDLVLFLLQSNVITQLFISILILSFILLLIFTVFAIVKNQYSEKQEPVTKIINASFKALFMYLLVPVATVVCLLVGNIILQAIDGGTNVSNSTSASGMLFKTAAYNANKLRGESPSDARLTLKSYYNLNIINENTKNRIKDEVGVTADNIDSIESTATMEKIATIIDEQIANGDLTTAYSNLVGQTGVVSILSSAGQNSWNYHDVSLFYDTFRLSYITVWIGGAFLIGAIGKICWGLIARLFKITIYYAISPAVMATFPIDNGGALGKWRGAMVQQATSAYAAVGVINILYSILPVFNNIDIGTGLGGSIIKLFITIIAFKSADDLIKTVSGWFGTGDVMADGKAAKEQVGSSFKNAASKTMGTFAGIKGGMKGAEKLGKNKVWGGMLGGFMGSGLAEKTGLDPSKFLTKDGEDKGEKFYKDIYSNLGPNAKANKAAFARYDEQESLKKQWTAYAGEGSVYNRSNDNGKNRKQEQYRHYWANKSNAEALYRGRQESLEQDKFEHEKESKFSGIVDETNEANKEYAIAQEEYNDEIEALFDTTNVKEEWIDAALRGEELTSLVTANSSDEDKNALAHASATINEALRLRLSAAQESVNTAKRAQERQQAIFERRQQENTEFVEYLNKYKLVEKDGRLVDDSKIQVELDRVAKKAAKLAKDEIELEKDKAEYEYKYAMDELDDKQMAKIAKDKASQPKN